MFRPLITRNTRIILQRQRSTLSFYSTSAAANPSNLQVTPQPPITLFDADTKEPVTTDALFKGKKVVVFGVPGAFTPVCSNKHVPSFQKKYNDLKQVADEVICLAVNDVYVLKAWKDSANEKNIRYIADPAAKFVKSLGLDADLSAANLGIRSKRFSMYVDNGKVKFLNVEDSPGNFEKTSAETILEQLKQVK